MALPVNVLLRAAQNSTDTEKKHLECGGAIFRKLEVTPALPGTGYRGYLGIWVPDLGTMEWIYYCGTCQHRFSEAEVKALPIQPKGAA